MPQRSIRAMAHLVARAGLLAWPGRTAIVSRWLEHRGVPAMSRAAGGTARRLRGGARHIAAAPPSSVMNLRRLITCPWVRIEPHHIIEYESRCALQQNWPPMSLVGHSRPTHSAPVPANVRCYSNSDQNFAMPRTQRWAMYGRRPRCKRNLTFCEAFGCSHVYGLFSNGGLTSISMQPLWPLALM